MVLRGMLLKQKSLLTESTNLWVFFKFIFFFNFSSTFTILFRYFMTKYIHNISKRLYCRAILISVTYTYGIFFENSNSHFGQVFTKRRKGKCYKINLIDVAPYCITGYNQSNCNPNIVCIYIFSTKEVKQKKAY